MHTKHIAHNRSKKLVGRTYLPATHRYQVVLALLTSITLCLGMQAYGRYLDEEPVLVPPIPENYHFTFESAQAETVAEQVVIEEPITTDKQEVMDYIVEVFGDNADKAIWLAKCESGLRKNAINDKNRNGTVDYGIFQINSVHVNKRGSEFTTDWKANVRVAKKIYDEQGFRPWVCAKSIGEKNYLGH